MKRYFLPAAAFLFPFLYHFRLVYPNSSLLVLENDFGFIYYSYKAYVIDLMAHGHFPMWSPAEGGGYSLFGNPFPALLYPLNVIPLLVRLLLGNYNYWHHQIFTVLGVSIFTLGTYRWLLQSFNSPGVALFTAATLSASWSIGSFMRFPNAIHTIAWVPWVLAAIRSAHYSARPAPIFVGILALVCEITAGYPYFVVYSFFFYAAYLGYLHWVTSGLKWRERLFRQAIVVATSVLLCAPYTSAVSRLMSVTADRPEANFAFATEHRLGPLDFVASFVFPPAATMEACFYPGILTGFLIALYLWKGDDAREKVAVTVGAIGLLAIATGARSYLFAPLWTFVPIVGQLRVFPRMTIMLLPIFAVAVHQGCVFLCDQLGKPVNDRELSLRRTFAVFAAMFFVQVLLYVLKLEDSSYDYHMRKNFPAGAREVDFLMFTIITFAVVAFAMGVDWAKAGLSSKIALAILLTVVSLDTGTQGRFLWTFTLPDTLRNSGVEPGEGRTLMRQALELARRKADYFRLLSEYFVLDRSANLPGLTTDGLSRVPTPNMHYASYTAFFRKMAPQPDSLNRVMGKQKLFLHASLHADPSEFLQDAAGHPDAFSVEYFDGNELRVAVETTGPEYLTWIDNWDPGWSARVDGLPVSIEQSMGTFKAVRLASPGNHRVRFVYRPSIGALAYVAMTVGALSLGLMLLWHHRRRGASLRDE